MIEDYDAGLVRLLSNPSTNTCYSDWKRDADFRRSIGFIKKQLRNSASTCILRNFHSSRVASLRTP